MPLRDYNDVTRMTRLQLADRIRQMETTAARNSQLGAPNERHRPMEDRKRREKIARYQEELDRRTLADAAQAQADARQEEADAATVARQIAADADARATRHHAPTCSQPRCTAAACTGLDTDTPLCAKHGITAAADRYAAEQSQTEPEEAPEPECHCYRTGDTDNAADCPLHGETNMHRDRWTETAHAAEDAEPYRQIREDQLQRQERDNWRKELAADQGSTREDAPPYTRPSHAAPIAPPIPQPATPDTGEPAQYTGAADQDALTVKCPQCGAEPQDRCYTYNRSSHCAPHHSRKTAAAPRTPNARQAKHDAKETTKTRRATVKTARDATRAEIAAAAAATVAAADARESKLHAAIDALLDDGFTGGDVIEATWDRAAARFHPNQETRRQEQQTA